MHIRRSSKYQNSTKMASPSPEERNATEESQGLVQKLHLQSINRRKEEAVAGNDDGRTNNRILVRKNRHKITQGAPGADTPLRKTMNYLSTQLQPQENLRDSQHFTPLSEKDRFIDILQSKILKSNHEQHIDSAPKNLCESSHIKMNSTRYNNFHAKTYRVSLPHQKLNNSFEESKEVYHKSTEPRLVIRSQRAGRTENHATSFRSRSKTITKELASNKKVVGENISRTIEVNSLEQKEKMHKSLIEIERYEKKSHGRYTKDISEFENLNKTNQEAPLNETSLPQNESVIQELDSVNLKNTEIYENEVNVLTRDFFQEWDKMNTTKSKIYKFLRKKFVTIFPNMKKHYRQFKQSSLEPGSPIKEHPNKLENIDELMMMTNDLKSDPRPQRIFPNSSLNSMALANVSEVKDYQQKLQQFHQKQLLKQIFKQAYFWSRTKNKYMSTNFLNDQQSDKQEMVRLKKIQKNLTFMNYIKSKNNKSQILHNNNKIKGSNIIKNKDSILEIEKEGTKQQRFLKKCLDNAIENCIRENQ